jgi:hypothetical protein
MEATQSQSRNQMESHMEATQLQSQIDHPKTAGEVLAEMRQLMAQENLNQHAMGELYIYTEVNQIAENAGYKDAAEFFAENIKELSRATLTRYGAVAEAFTAEQCAQFGVTRLGLLLTYEEVAGIEADRNNPGGTNINVPDENGVVSVITFADCTVDDMRTALQRLRKPTSSAPLPPEATAHIQRYRDAFTRLFGKKNRIRVEGRNRKGKVILFLSEVPLEDADKVGAVLKDGIQPVPGSS